MFRLSSKILAATSDIESTAEVYRRRAGTLLKIVPDGRDTLPTRTILKDRDAKPLVESLKRLGGHESLSHKSRIEIETVKDAEIVFADGEPLAIRRNGELIPVLVNHTTVDLLPTVVVDMGAVPHVVSGADIMAPGIRRSKGDFLSGQLLVVVDEKHGKRLAIGKALLSSTELGNTKKGKVVENLHYVGDPVWESVKTLSPASSQQS